VLHEHWAARTGERRDPQIFMHLLARGRIVLLLDSFDEMGVSPGAPQRCRAVPRPRLCHRRAGDTARGNRILVTCREQYFRDKREAEDAVAAAAATAWKARRAASTAP
jgi:hypothetical protein